MGISAAMIVKDSERCLLRALESIIDAVDEIIIVDTGSTDRTTDIARSFAEQHENVKLFHYKWIEDFSAARNFSLSLVSHDWVFVVDADDYLPPEHRDKPRAYTERMDRTGDRAALYIVYDNTVGGRITSTYEDAYLRIFPAGLRYMDPIHEYVDTGQIRKMKSDIHLLHDGYDPDVTDTMQKTKRNLILMQRALKADKDNARLWMQLGREMKPFDKVKARRYLDIAEEKSRGNAWLINWINKSREGL
ncbi:glycosyltransferase family 2 protein [Paenibacillus sepulcri]|uniref:Glycosyltransferase family 2 protein n=1 Tax=Paenibacillus sepulcri TaxID=359917 RepID=A0ABS7BXW0_9BACL|nr:glycosyltransferase family 2 protein [Paenibacillus sepulcri]